MFDKNLFSVINLINNTLPLLKASKDDKSIIITAAIAGVEKFLLLQVTPLQRPV